MQVLAIMTWDIKAGKDEEYFNFVARDYLVGVQRIDWQIKDAWYTVYGSRPKIMVVAMAESLDKMNDCLQSEAWQEVYAKLLNYVTGFQQKVVPFTPYFPLP